MAEEHPAPLRARGEPKGETMENRIHLPSDDRSHHANATPARQRPHPLAVQPLNRFDGNREVRMGERSRKQHTGCTISQVEEFLELPRRDIQRACYAGPGGAAILSPKDSSWGRRTYDAEDMAKLFLVKRYRDQGLSLPEIKEVLERAERSGGWRKLLLTHISRLEEQLEDTAHQLACAKALQRAIDLQHKDQRKETES